MRDCIIGSVIAASSGKVVGKTRLQKMIYLLDALGMKSGRFFYYHHYGPYSDDLSSELTHEQRQVAPSVQEETEITTDGYHYSIFKLLDPRLKESPEFGALDSEVATQKIAQMNRETSTVLELAATIHWLKHKEGIADWRSELRRRKGHKVADGRQQKAERLLQDLGIRVD